jgi:hypothetical protein
VAVKEAYLVPDRDPFGGADLDTRRCEGFQVSIMVPGHNLYVWDYFDETFKEFWDMLPFFQLNFRNRMFHIAKEDESSGMGVVDDLAELLQQTRDLRGHVNSLMGQ